MACKTCGGAVAEQKERRVLQGTLYSALVDVVGCKELISDLHRFLASSGQTYICKVFYSTLNKYSGIMDAISTIRENVREAVKGYATPAGATVCPANS